MLGSSSMHFYVTDIERVDVRGVQDFIKDGSLSSYMRASHSANSISHFVNGIACDDMDSSRVCFR